MDKSASRYLLFFMLVFCSLYCLGQETTAITDSIFKKAAFYSKKMDAPTLFVHFDKTVYVSNEMVWFTAYLLNSGKHINDHTILCVTLIKNDTRKVITAQKFVMANGLSFGNMQLPDSIPPGNYTLSAYTNLMEKGLSLDVFNQAITIKTVDASSSKAVKSTVTALSFVSKKYLVKFYPEGGNMVSGLTGRIGWEVKDGTGRPVNTRGVLLIDGKPFDTIETSGYGMGAFYLKPQMVSHYSFKLLGADMPDTSYMFPPVKPAGTTVSIANALAVDTLKIRIANDKPGKVLLIIHNYKEVFFAVPVETNELGRIFKITLNDIPKGLTTATVLNEKGQPLAERIFFAHYDPKQQLKININTDQDVYGTRKKVTLHLKLNSVAASSAMVSIACVQGNRVEEMNKQDIASYYYLKHTLENLPYKDGYFGGGENDKQYLENVLLIKGWRRYKWEDLTKVTAADTLKNYSIPVFTGSVTKDNGKSVGKSTPLTLFSDSSVHIVMSDNIGKFEVRPEYLTVRSTKKPYFLLQLNTVINFSDPFLKTDQQVAKELDLTTMQLTTQQNPDAFKITGMVHTVQLKEVTIKAGNDESLYASKAVFDGGTRNDCGDYVCLYGVLNCPNHPGGGSLPIKGRAYANGTGGVVLYYGCETITKKKSNQKFVNSIYLSQEFYGFDGLQIPDPMPEYLSTIYWNHSVKINNDREVNLTFYTGDITGEFKIIVQGVEKKDVIYREKKFIVK